MTPTNVPSPDLRLSTGSAGGGTAGGGGGGGSSVNQQQQQQQLNDYDGPNQAHKRPRITSGWST